MKYNEIFVILKKNLDTSSICIIGFKLKPLDNNKIIF